MRFHRYAYLFVDGVNVAVRLGEDSKLCLLVVIGVREDGCKELLAVEDGYRESEDSWAAVLRDLRDRGMNEPKLVTGDGALGAWAALRRVFPGTREQRCWVHKTANVLDALPKRLQLRAKSLLHEMAEAPSRAVARKALERFRSEFDAKYPKAVAKLDEDWDALTAFYSFPAEHWRHLRTTDESVKGARVISGRFGRLGAASGLGVACVRVSLAGMDAGETRHGRASVRPGAGESPCAGVRGRRRWAA